MKTVKKISLFAVTLFVIVVSLFLPYISSLTVDHHLSKQIKEMGSSNISLSLSDNMEILEGLNWFYRPVDLNDEASVKSDALGYDRSTMVELSEYSQLCRLSREKVSTVAVEIIKEINAENFVSGEPTEIVPRLMISTGEEVATKTRIYWRCLWIDEEAEANAAIWIDDKSGQMVSLMMEYTDASDSEIPEIVYDLGKYCLVHYQADEVQCRKETDEYFFIDLTVNSNGEDFVCSVPVRQQNNELIFFNN